MNELTKTQQPTAENLAVAYYEKYSSLANAKNTNEGYKYAVIAYQKYNGNEPLTYNGTRAMVDGLQADGISSDTINQYLGRLCKILSWAVKVGICKTNFLDSDIFPRLKTVEKLHQNVTDTMDFDKILDSVKDIRDRAILVLLGVAGLRKSEVVNIDIADISQIGGMYQVLITNAKNGKQRWAIVNADYSNEITEYLKTIEEQQKELFVGKKTKTRLNVKSIDYIVKQYGEFSPHKYRHRTAECLYQSGAGVDDIAEVIGNSVSVCAKVYKGIDTSRQAKTSGLLRRGKEVK